MGQISIKIQNRVYRLSCGDGEEQRLTDLAEYVREKADQLTDEFGRISEEHMLVMSAILIADELWDERDANTAQKTGPHSANESANKADKSANQPSEKQPVAESA